MAFAVVLCPDCRLAMVCDPSTATTGCGRCGKRVEVDAMRFFHEGEDHAEAVRVAGAVNARRDDAVDAFLEEVAGDGTDAVRTPLDAAVRAAQGRSGAAKLRHAVRVLAGEVDATPDRVAELLSRLDRDDVDAAELLERAAREGDLVEVSPSRYRPSDATASDGGARSP